MLLAVDIGNTQSVLGFIDGTSIIQRLRIATNRQQTVHEWTLVLEDFSRTSGVYKDTVYSAIIASVVPELTSSVTKSIATVFGTDPFVVTAASVPNFKTRYKNPLGIGPDRIANAVAAHVRYNEAVVVVDLGTATTYDVVAADGEYLGGIIVPGLETSFEGLSLRAAMLPRVVFKMPQNVVGVTTQECMQSGIMFGTIDQIRGMLARIEAELGYSCRVILTGGLATLFTDALGDEAEIDVDLTLEGLQYISSMITEK